jgi:mannitol operon transcriptional antiterminator
MKKRSVDILQKILSYDSSILNITKLAELHQVSQKTLRNDIADINLFLKQFQIRPIEIVDNGILKIGTNINPEFVKDQIFKLDSYSYKLSPEERQLLILTVLLKQKSYLTMDYLAEMLSVSRITILSDVESAKEILAEFTIELCSKSSKGIYLKETNIMKIRMMLIELCRRVIVDIKSDGYFQRLILSQMNTSYSLHSVIAILQDFEREKNMYFSDYVFYELTLYLFICINQLSESTAVPCEQTLVKQSGELSLAKNLLCYAEQRVKVKFTAEEFNLFDQYIVDNHLLPMSKTIDDIELYNMITYFLVEIGNQFDIDFCNDHILLESLFLHIRCMSDLIDFQFPIDENIQPEYKRIMSGIDQHSYILEQYLGYSFNEKMKLSIYIHICAALVRNKNFLLPLHVIIVCPGSMATGRFVEAQVKNYFDFTIQGVISVDRILYTLEKSKEKIDFIISTVELPKTTHPVVRVNPLLKMQDLNNIQKMALSLGENTEQRSIEKRKSNIIQSVSESLNAFTNLEDVERFSHSLKELLKKHSKTVNNNKHGLCSMLKKEMILLVDTPLEWQTAIDKAGRLLYQKKFIKEEYIHTMIRNIEQYGPYIIVGKGVALAHAKPSETVLSEGLSLVVAPKGIKMDVDDKKRVYLLFAFCTQGGLDYIELFNQIAAIGRNPSLFAKCLEAEETAEIYHLLCS